MQGPSKVAPYKKVADGTHQSQSVSEESVCIAAQAGKGKNSSSEKTHHLHGRAACRDGGKKQKDCQGRF